MLVTLFPKRFRNQKVCILPTLAAFMCFVFILEETATFVLDKTGNVRTT